MGVNYIPLPAYRGGGGLDFGGLNDGLDFLIKQNDKNRLLQQAKDIGAALLPGQPGQPQAQNALLGAPGGRPSPAAQAQATNLTQQYSPSQGPSSPASGAFAAAGRDYQPDTPEIAAIKSFEGYTPNTAPDFKQNSNGYGTRALPGETTIDRGTAEERLRAEVAPLRATVDREVPNANPQQRAALISAGYNLGGGKGGMADFIPQAQAGDWSGAGNRLLNYNHAGGEVNPGLTTRRAQEAAMLTGGSSPAAAPTQQAGPSASPAAAGPSAVAGPNYDAAIAVAAKQGNMQAVMQLTALKQQADTQARQGRLDERQLANDAQTHQLQDVQIQGAQMALHDKLAMKAAGVAQLVLDAPAEQKAAMAQKIYALHPEFAANLQAHGVDPSNIDQSMSFLIAEARGLTDKKSFSTAKPGDAILDASGRVINTVPGSSQKLPSGYKRTPDGNLTFEVGGPADPSVKPKGRDKYTEVQSRAANFANMMTKAAGELGAHAPLGPDGQPGTVVNPKNILGAARDGIFMPEGWRNAMRPDDTQAYEQSAQQWIRAKLRKESGAAIGKDEMANEFLTFFPQYWDGPETVAQKARAREEATKGMIAESGGAYGQMFPPAAAPGGPEAGAQPVQNGGYKVLKVH